MQICPRCGTVIREGETECAWCKAPLLPKEVVAQPSAEKNWADNIASRWPLRISPRAWLSLFLLTAGCLLVAMTVFGVLGVYRGTRDRTFENRRAAVVHYQKGLEYLRADRRELAAAEFREAVHLVPDFTVAQEALQVVESEEGNIQSIPTLTPASDVLAALYAEGKSLYDNKQWAQAATKLEELVGAAPDYREGEVQTLLFNAHMQAGIAATEANAWDEALQQFDQALALRPNDPDAMRQRRYAETYRQGMQSWNSAWDLAIQAFERIYQESPQYHDVAVRLREAHIQYGNVFYGKHIWCQAAEQYQAAIQVDQTAGTSPQNLQAQKTDAGRRCDAEKRRAAATRPPTPPTESTPAPEAGAPPAPGYSFVAVGPPAPDYGRGCSGHYIFGEVYNSGGEPLSGVHIRAVDQWGNVYENTSKNPPDQGMYDIPVNNVATSYQVSVVDEANVALSTPVVVTDTGQFVDGSEACWNRLDWQQK